MKAKLKAKAHKHDIQRALQYVKLPRRLQVRQYADPVVPEGELHPLVREYLLTGTQPPKDELDYVLRNVAHEHEWAKSHWKAYRRELLAEGKRRGFTPFGCAIFGDVPIPELPAWHRHFPDPRSLLDGRPIKPCPRCGGVTFDRISCLS